MLSDTIHHFTPEQFALIRTVLLRLGQTYPTLTRPCSKLHAAMGNAIVSLPGLDANEVEIFVNMQAEGEQTKAFNAAWAEILTKNTQQQQRRKTHKDALRLRAARTILQQQIQDINEDSL